MRGEGVSSHQVAVLVSALCLAGSAWAQAPPPKPKKNVKKQAVGNTAPSRAALLITVDEACTLTVNGSASRQVAAGQTVRIPIADLGEQLIEARSHDGRVVSETVLVDKPGQRVVRLSVATPLRRGPLMWARRDNGADVDWHEAKAHCEGLSLAGYDDWRLPSIEELETLHDPGGSESTLIFDGKAHPINMVSGFQFTGFYLWSSTKEGSSSAWFFLLGLGDRTSTLLDSDFGKRALCVRSSGE